MAGPHLCSLVLEPDLDHTHAEARLRRQRLPDLLREGGRVRPGVGRHREVAGPGGWAGRCRDAQVPAEVWKGSGCGGVSPARPPLTFRQGLEETSKEALKALRCCVVRMVRGRLGLRRSFPSSPLLWLPCPLAGFMSPSSSLALHCRGHDAAGQPVSSGTRCCWGPVTSCQHLTRLPRGLQVKTAPFPRPTGPASSSLISCPPTAPPSPVCFPSSANGPCVLISALWGRPEPKPPDLPC